ncbi:MAG: hypothetical protein M1823_000336 [Watsoniomyces obsoletus]|nr:MAG: hypothetical protein M1823_000336 [Watsoniomyces obsoletus]
MCDERVRIIDHSLGVQTPKVRSFLEGSHANRGRVEWEDLHTLYKMYEEGGLSDQGLQQLKAVAKDPRNATLGRADVAITTSSNADAAAVYDHFKPDVVYVDEAAAAYSIGGNNKSCLLPHLEISLFERAKGVGGDSILFREQQGMSTGIARAPSDIFYHGHHLDADSTTLEHYPKARAFARFLTEHYPTTNNTSMQRFLEVKRTANGKRTKSTYNISTAKVGFQIIEKLIDAGIETESNTVVVPYQTQKDMYRAAIHRYHKARGHVSVDFIRVRNVDGFQGGKADYPSQDVVL